MNKTLWTGFFRVITRTDKTVMDIAKYVKAITGSIEEASFVRAFAPLFHSL